MDGFHIFDGEKKLTGERSKRNVSVFFIFLMNPDGGRPNVWKGFSILKATSDSNQSI